MSVTISNIKRHVGGGKFHIVADVTFSSSYVTGGSSEAITPSSIGLVKIDYITILPASGFTFEHSTTTNYVKVYGSANLTVYQDAAPTTAQTVTVKVGDAISPKMEGVMSPAADQTIVLGPMAEIPAAYTGFTGITSRLHAVGH